MKTIADVIKYEGNNTTFVWKHPIEDFNTMTQLIVHESQEAVFFMNGQALDLFGAGRYTLETQNIPKIGKILNRATDDVTPFHCEVYFVNITEQMAIKWGTDSKIQYTDPVYKIPLSIGASGEMSIRVEDSRKLLIKVVGTEETLSQEQLTSKFRGLIAMRVKSYIPKVIKEQCINVFDFDEKLDLFSQELQKLLVTDFKVYGLSLERFIVKNIVKPDGEKTFEDLKNLHYREYADIQKANLQKRVSIIEAETDAQRTIIDSEAQARKRALEGYSYQQEQGFEVMKKVAANEGSGSDLRNAAMGMGLGFSAGGFMGSAMNEIANGTMRGLMEPIPQNRDSDEIPGIIKLKDEENTEKKIDDTEFQRQVMRLKYMKEQGVIDDEKLAMKIEELLNTK